MDEKSAIIIDAVGAGAGSKPVAAVSVQTGSVRGVISGAGTGAVSAPLIVRSADGAEATLVPESGEDVEFRLSMIDNALEVAVRKGALALVSSGNETRLGPGEAADVSKRGVSRPVKLLAFPTSVAPGIDARYRFEDGMRVELRWEAVRGASSYRVQVARSLAFRSIVANAIVEETGFVFSPEEPGTYVWRIAAHDAKGRAGEFGFARRLFCELKPPTDLLVAPRDRTKLAYTDKPPKVTFSWQSAGDAERYRLSVSRSANPLADPIVDEVTSGQRHTVDFLGDGRYHWGVYARGDEDVPIFLKPRSLTIRRRKAPRADTKELWD